MSININGRVVQVILQQNTGDSSGTGTELDITGYLSSLGDISWTVDETLTKLSFGDMSLTIADDETSTVWNFIEHSLTSDSGLLWPWCYLLVDGVMVFIGVIRSAPVQSSDVGTQQIQISVTSWASMLEATRIAPGDPALSRRDTFFTGESYAAGPDVEGKSVYNKELRRGHDRGMVAVPSSEQNNFSVGDWVYVRNYSDYTYLNKRFRVEGAQMADIGGLGTRWCLYLGGFSWSEHPGDNANFGQTLTLYRCYSSISKNTDPDMLPVFVVAESWDSATAGTTAKTSIALTYSAGLWPGDKLDLVTNVMAAGTSSYTITITDIDPITSTIYVDTPLSQSLTSGVTSFQVQAASLSEVVLMPVTTLLTAALKGFAPPDLTHYQPEELVDSCFSFASPESPRDTNHSSENIHTLAGVMDIQSTLTGFDVHGISGKGWAGTPTSGWSPATWVKKVSWTSQMLSAPPAYLMPFVVTPPDDEDEGSDDRGRTLYPGLGGDKGDPAKDPKDTRTASYKAVYDYSNFRRYLFKFGNTGSLASVTYTTWNGTSWSAAVSLPTTGVGQPRQILSMPGTSSSSGSGNGLLGIYSGGVVKTLFSTVPMTLQLKGDVVSTTGIYQCLLAETSNGIYYTTPLGYGSIRVVSGALSSQHMPIIDTTNRAGCIGLTVTPLTPLVYANGTINCLAKYSYKSSISDARTTDDTHLMTLAPDVTSGALYSDKVVSNIPRATMMVKSPISEDIFGFMGSRLFQVATRLPDTVERFTAANQTAAALIEFAGVMTNTVPVPCTSGALQFYTRGRGNGGQTNIVTVDVVSASEARWNKHVASCVVVKGMDCSEHAVSDSQKAGLTISLTNEAWIRNSSQARAIAKSMLAFFEMPRHELEQVWYSEETPAPWERLKPLEVFRINGGPTLYYLTGLTQNFETRTAKVSLLEV